MPGYSYVILAVGWTLWILPFLLFKRSSSAPEKLDRRARWGVLLEILAYSLLWQSDFWARSPSIWRIALAIVFFILACPLSWAGVRALGRQWRIDAGLNPDHQLVQIGPYRIVRHPIYTSMICMLLGTGFMITPWPILLLATVLFMIGTEVRMRIEDQLLASRFGNQFREYQKSVPAYIPLLR
jgi:protein-S-isoprenylcysteine O-methyltransferase Ste14